MIVKLKGLYDTFNTDDNHVSLVAIMGMDNNE